MSADTAETLGQVAARELRLPAGVVPSPEPIPSGMTVEDLRDLRHQQAAHVAGWYVNHRPALYADAHLDDLDEEQDFTKVRGWLQTGSRTLLLTGPVGTGKTHAAYAVANAAVQRGLLTVAVAVPDLLATLRPGSTDSGLAARARAADLLVLDDLGAEKPSEWTGEQLSALLDARVRDDRRQIITTNSTYTELAERLGARTMSRLTGGATIVRFTGEDRRRSTW